MKSSRAENTSNTGSALRGNRAIFADRIEQVKELFPLTVLGVLVAVLAVSGLSKFGFDRLDLVWYVAALCALMLIALTICSVLLGIYYLRKSMNSEDADTRQKCITGVACKTGFSMPLMRWLPLVETQLSWYQPEHTSIELHQHGNRLQEWATPGLHGDVNQIERRIRVSDVLGLAAVTLRYQTGGNLAVLPNPGALGNLPWLTSFNSGEDLPHPHGAEAGDRTELRRYHSGDSTRFIHWKAFARSRKLMQRAPERSLSKTERTAAYLIAGQGDSASAAAALAALLSAGSETEFVFGADGTAEPVKTRSEIEAAIRDSAVQRKNGGKNLSAFIDTILSRGIANIMLFVPSLGGEWESKVYPLLADSELTYKVVIGIDGLEESPKSPLWYRLIMRTDATSDQKTGQLKKLVIRLEAAGAQVLVADRRSGRLFNARHLETGISSTKTYEQGAVQTA